MNIIQLLSEARQRDASDLHISTGLPPMLRIHGKLVKLDFDILTADQVYKCLIEVLTEQQVDDLAQNKDIDFALEYENVGRLRVNFYYDRLGLCGAFRLIPAEIISLYELGMPASVSSLAQLKMGLILVTGPTGSGKSTTLAAMIDMINSDRNEHIITIEDPIEFVHSHKKCIINQREIGPNAMSFKRALRASLREDPDIILVGEMRDLETISMAITAAETGHLVLATLHTNSCAETIDRMIDVFPGAQQKQIRTQLSICIQSVITQTLIPTITRDGRVVAVEVMIGNSAIRSLIRESKSHQINSVIQTCSKEGMQSMDQSLQALLNEKRISYEDAVLRAEYKEDMRRI